MSIIEKAMERARREQAEQVAAFPETPPIPELAPQVPEKTTFVENKVWQDGNKEEVATVVVKPVPELIMAHSRSLNVGGEYRLLKEYLLSLRKSRPDMSLFMVASSMRNEGKTTVSCNLATAFAQEFDHTVLLVDMDLRAPTCHRMFGLSGRPKGVVDCLLHNVSFSDVVIHTNLGRLSLLPAGSAMDESPSELFTSNRMIDFLAEIKHRYPDRIIILDTVPLLPFAESRALSRIVDGVLLVVRENVTSKAHLEATMHALDGAPLLGVVYNGASSYGTDKEIFELVYDY